MFDLLQVWVLVEVLGVICLPITVTVCHNLPDRGWAFSKALGLAIFTFCTWFPLMCLHTLSYSQAFIVGVVLFLVVCGVFGYWRTHREIIKIMRRNKSYIVLTELVFFGMVLLLGWLRSLLPDIYSFEMFMDEGFIAAIMRSPHLPPHDMWYAGQSINYYYYCHFAVATLAKLLGQSPSIAFNTGISMYFGLTAVNLFGVSSNIVAWARHSRKHAQTQPDREPGAASEVYPPLAGGAIFGLFSMVIGLILGNLAATQQWWQQHGNAAVGGFDWFAPSRVINKTINEFPAFSFLLSCFHAHVLALGFAILAAGLAFNLFLEKDGVGLFAFGRGWQIPITLLTTALVIGGLFVMNGWDMPTYLGLAIVCIALQQWRSYEQRFSLFLFVDVCTAVFPLIFCTFLLFLPFYLNFNSPSQGLGWVRPEDRSPLGSEFLIYGLFLFIFVSLLVLCASRQPLFRQRNDGGDGRQIFIALASLGALLVVDIVLLFLIKNSVTLIWMGSITIIGVVLLLYHIRDHALSFTLLLGVVAFFLVAACEVFFLADAFAGNFPRMNTVFKFYFQAWGLLSIAAGSGMYFLCCSILRRSEDREKLLPLSAPYEVYDSDLRVEDKSRTYIPYGRDGFAWGGKMLWLIALALLLVASTAYPLLAPSSRLQVYTPAPQVHSASLDGLNYLKYYRPFDLGPETHPSCTIDVGGDYYAIRWINSHIQGDPVMVEGVGDVKSGTVGNGYDYTMYSRISTFTGLPTLLGWSGHEVQWRLNWLNDLTNYQNFLKQIEAVNIIYTSPNPQQVLATMRQYNAQYLYVGPMECLQYTSYNFPQLGSIDLQRFGAFMQVVYAEHGVTIYKMK
jgi:YYY domain-containing protein